jgi:membrane-associated protease RseP (regulator of RpoE activity)
MFRRSSIMSLAVAVIVGVVGISSAQAAPPHIKVAPPHHRHAVPRLGFYGHAIAGHGIVIDRVVYGSEAHRIGLERGDIIVGVNNYRIRSADDYFRALRLSSGVLHLRVLDVRGRGVVSLRAYVPYDPDHYHILGENRGRR